ncbi:hypothetical protein ACXEO8_05960 [Cytobacillus firmus]|uniref:hypothetical protein n=1 Tax=Bacillus sp. 22-7 TaxID=2709707 RepID=UPI0013D2EB72|nr:hypothetical protein [Bacillus sp. 22-7]
MLVNCKNEELKKYSKGTYNPELLVPKIKNRWELTDLQFRMACMISDLAINGQGVFSIAHNTFVEMFEERFRMKISLSSVRRFFGLLQNIGILTINAAKRKNNKQSANIYIIESIEQEITNEQPDEHPEEQACEPLYEQHNIALKNTLNKASKEPLKHEFVNNIGNKDTQEDNADLYLKQNNIERVQDTYDDEIIYKLTNEYRAKGLSKEVCLRVVDEVMQVRHTIENFPAYLATCLKNTLYKSQVKHGLINPYERMRERLKGTDIPYFDWLNASEEESKAELVSLDISDEELPF